jgi:hypothetical protein
MTARMTQLPHRNATHRSRIQTELKRQLISSPTLPSSCTQPSECTPIVLDTDALGNDMDTFGGNALDLRGVDEQWQANMRFMEPDDKGYEILPPSFPTPQLCICVYISMSGFTERS